MNIQKLTQFFGAAVLAAGLVFAPVNAIAVCKIFQHRDYGGVSLTLHNNDRVIMTEGEDIGMTTNGHGDSYRIFYRPDWNDHLSSFKVTNGCTISIWQHINKGGPRFRSNRSYLYVGDRWNDEASDVVCNCP